MRPHAYDRQRNERVHVFDATPMPWEEQARPGLRMKTIRIDDERGEFLGLIGFDRFVRSAVHQHQGVASSFILEGGITDYHGPVHQHEMGINCRGSTHDAMAYVPTVLVSKLEGPRHLSAERAADLRHPRRLDLRELPQSRPARAARDQRARRRVAPGADRRRRPARASRSTTTPAAASRGACCSGSCGPRRSLPAWQATDWVELWVRGGEITVNGEKARANCFGRTAPGRRGQGVAAVPL